MISTRFASYLITLVIGVCVIHSTLAGEDGEKKKKIIIKVPQIIKHIHHHHVKKVHIFEEKPKQEFNHGSFYHSIPTTTKGVEGWPSGNNMISTPGAWKLPTSIDGWTNYFKKSYDGNFEGLGKTSDDKYGGGEAWKESDDSYGWKGSQDWENTWGGEKFGNGLSGGYEGSAGGGYDDVSHVMYELPLGASGNLGEVHGQGSADSYGESSFDGGNYESQKRQNRGLQFGTQLNQYMAQSQPLVRQPEIKHVYEPMEDDKQSDWIHGHEVPASRPNMNTADLGRMLLMQNADNSHLRAYLNGQRDVMRSNAEWMPFKGE